METQEISYISPFFQLPNKESKQELIFFPTSISLDSENFVNISYNVGDNRSYFAKLHIDLINISLYDKNNIDFLVNFNININYYLELIRNIRKYLGLSLKKSKYYNFINLKNKSLKKKKSKSNDINQFLKKEEFPFNEMKGKKIKDLDVNFVKKFVKSDDFRKNKKLIDLFYKYHEDAIKQSGGGSRKKHRTSKKNKKHTLHYFGTSWCGYCKKFNSVWNNYSKNTKHKKYVTFKKTLINDNNKHLVHMYDITSYPSLILVKNNGDRVHYLSDKRNKKSLDSFLKANMD